MTAMTDFNLKNISIVLAILLVATLILYNLIPFIIYLIRKLLIHKRKRAKQLDPNSRSSPWFGINTGETDSELSECLTVAQLFRKIAEKLKNKRSFGCRTLLSEEEEKQSDGKVYKKVVLSDYKWFTFEEVNQRVDVIGKGLLHIGVKPKDIVMIYAETRLEWLISCQSLFRNGVTVATLYTTLGEDGIIHGINEAEVTHLITNFELLSKLKPILDKIPKIESIVYINEIKDKNIETIFSAEDLKRIKLYSLQEIEELGKKHHQLKGEDPKPDDTAVLMYTSGSTGVPKGVMISHKNFMAAINAFHSLAHVLRSDDVYIPFLPLAHIMEMSAELFYIWNGIKIGFATTLTLTDKSSALKKGIRGDAPLLRPTIMSCVPLVADRIRLAITEELAKKPLIVRLFINVLFNLKLFWFKREIDSPVIDYLFCRKFKALLGGRVRIIAGGGAPISPQTHDFMRGFFNVHLLQGYGLTETSASAALMEYDDMGVETVGPPLEGIYIKLVDWEEGNYKIADKPNPRGEIVIGGNSVTKGYFKNDKLTQESYKEEDGIRWFLTGDIGEIDSNGSIKIIDRKKDIIKLSTGEYISLAKVETELKKNPLVDNICVYGDSNQQYLVALIVPNRKQLDSLTQKLSKSKMSFEEMCNDSEVNKKVLQSLKETTQTSKLHRSEIPTKIKLCSNEWSPESGLVTAALKLRRKNIQELYQKDIKTMYSNQSS